MGAGSSFCSAAWSACCSVMMARVTVWKSAPWSSSRQSFQLASNQYALICSSLCVLVRTRHLHHAIHAHTAASVLILTRVRAHSMASKASRSDSTPFGLHCVLSGSWASGLGFPAASKTRLASSWSCMGVCMLCCISHHMRAMICSQPSSIRCENSRLMPSISDPRIWPRGPCGRQVVALSEVSSSGL